MKNVFLVSLVSNITHVYCKEGKGSLILQSKFYKPFTISMMGPYFSYFKALGHVEMFCIALCA